MFDDLADLFAAADAIGDKYLTDGEKLIRDALLACERAEIQILLDEQNNTTSVAQ